MKEPFQPHFTIAGKAGTDWQASQILQMIDTPKTRSELLVGAALALGAVSGFAEWHKGLLFTLPPALPKEIKISDAGMDAGVVNTHSWSRMLIATHTSVMEKKNNLGKSKKILKPEAEQKEHQIYLLF